MQGSWRLVLFIQRRVGWVQALSLFLGAVGLLALAWAAQAPAVVPHGPVEIPKPQPVRQAPQPARWQAFVGQLPDAGELGQDLHQLFKLAGRHGVQLPRGEYQVQRDAQAQVTMFVASFPVTESYGQTRAFIAEVLNSLPHVALDDLAMERNAADQAVIGARLKFTFLYQDRR
jgi:hypothetical protein